MSDFYWINPFGSNLDPEPILRDAFKWGTQGIFVAIESVATAKELDLPWIDDDASILDMAYFGNHSGGKFCSPIVKLFLETESFIDSDGQLNQLGTEKLAEILLKKYLINWQRLWDTNVASYTPIHNYDMSEVSTTRKADAESENSDNIRSSSIGTETSSDETDYKYGINTGEVPKPSDKSEIGSEVSTSEDTETTNQRNKVGAEETEGEVHRFGNIGVTTTQKLLQEEREVWLWNYYKQIFSDLDKELVLMFHDPCRV